MSDLSRREFVGLCGGAAGALALPGAALGFADAGPNVQFPVAARDRIAVAAYPFREFIVGWKGWDGKTPSTVPRERQMELKDFAAHVVAKFNVRKVELWSPVFPSTDPKYLTELRAAIEKAGSGVVDIAVDAGFSQYSPDAAVRKKAVAGGKHWVDVGATIGSPSIRIHINEAKGVKPDVALTADTFAWVAEYAAKKNVVVTLENDNPVSEDPFFIVAVLEKVKSPWLRALPDFGNSVVALPEEQAYRAIDAMFAHAYGICHVKNGEDNDAGKFVAVDMERTFGILKSNGYKGYCSMEFDAAGDPYKATAELIEETVKGLG